MSNERMSEFPALLSTCLLSLSSLTSCLSHLSSLISCFLSLSSLISCLMSHFSRLSPIVSTISSPTSHLPFLPESGIPPKKSALDYGGVLFFDFSILLKLLFAQSYNIHKMSKHTVYFFIWDISSSHFIL